MPNNEQKIKCTICSYQDKLNITLNSNINDKDLQKCFLNQNYWILFFANFSIFL